MHSGFDFERPDNPFGFYGNEVLLQQREARRTFSRFSLALFFYLLIASTVTLIVEIVLMIALGEGYKSLLDNVYFVWLMSVVPMYLIAGPSLWLIVKNMKTRERDKKKLSFVEFICIFFVCQTGVVIGSNIGGTITSVIEFVIGKSIGTSQTIALIEKTPLWLMFLVVVVIGPIVEEFIFRKLMIDRLSRYGDFLAITVSSICFGLVHGNLDQLFYATLLGMIFGYVYVKTGNWLYSTLLHMLVNFFGSFVSVIFMNIESYVMKASEDLASGLDIDLTKYIRCNMALGSYSAIQTAFVIAGAVIFIYSLIKRKISVSPDREYKLLVGTTFNTAFLNVGFILFASLCFITVIMNIVLA